MFSVTLLMRAQPGQAEALANFWQATAQRVLASEPGCRAFYVSRDSFTIFELYESQEAFDLHHAPHPTAEAARAQLGTLRQTPVTRIVGRVIA